MKDALCFIQLDSFARLWTIEIVLLLLFMNSKFIMQSNRDLFNLGNMYPVTFSLFIYKGTFNGISLMAKIFLFIVVKPVTLQPGLDGDLGLRPCLFTWSLW
ncbi:hypothetical protein ACJX0J_003196 (mitochondrion) [Zea mays]